MRQHDEAWKRYRESEAIVVRKFSVIGGSRRGANPSEAGPVIRRSRARLASLHRRHHRRPNGALWSLAHGREMDLDAHDDAAEGRRVRLGHASLSATGSHPEACMVARADRRARGFRRAQCCSAEPEPRSTDYRVISRRIALPSSRLRNAFMASSHSLARASSGFVRSA